MGRKAGRRRQRGSRAGWENCYVAAVCSCFRLLVLVLLLFVVRLLLSLLLLLLLVVVVLSPG